MKRWTDEEAKGELKKYSENIKEDDIGNILTNQSGIMDKAVGPLKRFGEDIKLLFSMVKDYATKKYTELPWTIIAAVVGALAYVLNPIDLIPDFIPFLGLVDDAAVLALALKAIDIDLQKYKKWKQEHPDTTKQISLERDAENAQHEFLPSPQEIAERQKTQEIYDEEIRRLEKSHQEQMNMLQETLKKTTEAILLATNGGAISGVGALKKNESQIEDVQRIHKVLGEKRQEFRHIAVDLEIAVKLTTQFGFDMIIAEFEKIKNDTKLIINTHAIQQKFDDFSNHIEGSIIDVVTRKVSLGDTECLDILSIESEGERKNELDTFLKDVLKQGIENTKNNLEDLMWDAFFMVSGIFQYKIADKKEELQRTSAELESMKNVLSESEIRKQETEYKNEVDALERFIKIA
ncbi:MAG: hypothetical protein Ta2F_17660 [Termitinemataceae bacterium]|nr:MAG: hypothetical protein Ta2F_17660 [Termitinemataceae bacterium]